MSGIVQLQEGFQDVERLGQDVIRVKEEMIELDKRRQQNREGLTAIRKEGEAMAAVATARTAASKPPLTTAPTSNPRIQEVTSPSSSSPSVPLREPEHRVWLMRPGGVFMETSAQAAKTILTREQEEIEAQLEGARAEQKALVASLAEKGIAPDSVGPGLLQAYLNLRDTPSQAGKKDAA